MYRFETKILSNGKKATHRQMSRINLIFIFYILIYVKGENGKSATVENLGEESYGGYSAVLVGLIIVDTRIYIATRGVLRPLISFAHVHRALHLRDRTEKMKKLTDRLAFSVGDHRICEHKCTTDEARL